MSLSVVQSMQSLVNIDRISSVDLSTLRIINNYAAQYLTFDGDLSGPFTMSSIAVIDNINNGPFPSNTLINASRYQQATIHDSLFINNDNATILFGGVLNGSLTFFQSNFVDNDNLNTLVDMNGVSSLQVTTLTVSNNTANNGLLFRGTNSGDVDVNDLVFEYHNDDSSIQSETLLLFDLFINANMTSCHLRNNHANYLFKGSLSGDIVFSDCIMDQNEIDTTIINITSSGTGNVVLKDSNITNNQINT
eukprot:118081_1